MADTQKTKSQLINELEALRKKISEMGELKENEEKYRVLVEQSNDGAIIIQEQIVKYVNLRMAETLGYSVDEMINTNFLDYVAVDEHSKIMDIYTRRIQGEDVPNIYVLAGLHKDGRKVAIEINSRVGSFQGKPATIAFFRDTTERNKVEGALQKSEERFRTLFEDSADAYLILQDNIFVDCNQATVDMLRANTKEEVLSTHPSELSPEFQPDGQTSAKKADEMIGIALEEGSNRFEWMHRRVDGENFPVEVLLTPITVGGETIIHTAWRDITERKRAEEREREQHALSEALRDTAEALNSSLKLDDILEKILDNVEQVVHYDAITVVWVQDDELSVLRSRGYESENEIIEHQQKFPRRKFATFVQVIETLQPLVIPDVETSSMWVTSPFTKWVRSHIKVPIVIDENVVGLINMHNKIPDFYNDTHARILQTFANQVAIAAKNAMLYDALEDRVVERTAELKKVNQELEAFSYSISHDLRAPLRAINGFSEILAREYTRNLDEEGLEYLDKIRNASLRMDQLINALLSLSRLGRKDLNFQNLNLADMVKQIAANLSDSEPDRKLDFQIMPCGSAYPPARGDQNLIEILLTNLLSNAVKFTQNTSAAVIEFGCSGKDGENIYFVRDNGIGFDMAYVDKLFTPFQRLHSSTEYEGTGIGLALIQQIIHRHKGRVWVEAEKGKGATFYFTLGLLL